MLPSWWEYAVPKPHDAAKAAKDIVGAQTNEVFYSYLPIIIAPAALIILIPASS